jgi:hypothetical protein
LTRRNYASGYSSSSFLKENMTNYKEHCTKYLSNRLRGSSDWRRAQGTKFNDPRNDKASQRLLELESSIEITDAVWNEIAPYYNENENPVPRLGASRLGEQSAVSIIGSPEPQRSSV